MSHQSSGKPQPYVAPRDLSVTLRRGPHVFRTRLEFWTSSAHPLPDLFAAMAVAGPSNVGIQVNTNATPSNYELPWVEKYRPVFLDDVVGNTETIERLKIIAKDGNMPHVIISGMPGIGKTTSVLCLARQLLGDAYKEAVLELNASDERGIDVVRNRIKGFAQKKVTLPPGRQKLVILDEADSMTSGAQQALRRTMEIYSGTTRFAFACNQSNKIIEPLQSRCAILRYSRLTDGQVVKRLNQIIKAEGVQYSDDGLAALVFSAEGDMRQAINNLQSTWAGFGFVSGDNVFRVVDSPHPVKVQAMIKSCHDQKVDDALGHLQELWSVLSFRLITLLSLIPTQEPRLFFSRYHQYDVQSH
nr:replication factor c subunit 4 [Quercus suber]